ncbi:efflux RND transporter periplasmic adaptor subunit [Niveibacterium sp. SC-1]|uniref:efflux RND transporter periplasmic adaptor subunit n=1 Tax=Niveibacterium sp. SC-1 TaxID=3135646 RepID=UPI00311EC998
MPISERETQARARRWLNEVCRHLSGRGLEHARLLLGTDAQSWQADWNAAGAAAPAPLGTFAREVQRPDTAAQQQLFQGDDGLPHLLVGLPLSRSAGTEISLVLMLPASAQGDVPVLTAYLHNAFAWLRLWLAELPEARLASQFCNALAQQLPAASDAVTLPPVLAQCSQHWQQALICLVWRDASGELACASSDPERLAGLRDSLLLCWDSLLPGWQAEAACSWPPSPGQQQPTQALQQLARQAGQGACSAWVRGRAGQPLAVLLCLGEQVMARAGEAEWVLLALSQGLAAPVEDARGTGRSHWQKPLLWSGVAALALVALAWPWPHRLHEAGRLAGSTERVVVSTQAGYLAEVRVRPGDAVKAGQLLARLDDQSLHQELARWEAEVSRHETRYLQAMAQREVTEAAAVQGELQEARAQAELARLRLAQASLQAPIDGVVVSGDLDRAVGTAVAEGEALMRIAPPGSYRVLFDVDEDQARLLHAGQAGELRPSATPGERYPLQVARVAPLARVVEGRNRVEVEARVPGTAPALKPGQGVTVSVELEQRSGAWLVWDGLRREIQRLWWRSGVGG